MFLYRGLHPGLYYVAPLGLEEDSACSFTGVYTPAYTMSPRWGLRRTPRVPLPGFTPRPILCCPAGA